MSHLRFVLKTCRDAGRVPESDASSGFCCKYACQSIRLDFRLQSGPRLHLIEVESRSMPAHFEFVMKQIWISCF